MIQKKKIMKFKMKIIIYSSNLLRVWSICSLTDRFTALGCLDDIITLSCPDTRTLWVTNAFYGRYNYTCSATCCPPSPWRDCAVQVEQCEPNDWVALKYTCDNKTSCDWQYTGRVLDECEAGYVADYMQIFFDCLPGIRERVFEYILY